MSELNKLHEHTRRSDELKANITKRLNRIEGQVRGVNKMIDEDKYCDDVLIQIVSIKSALDSVSKLILENHMRGCLVRDIQNGYDETITELLTTIGRMVK